MKKLRLLAAGLAAAACLGLAGCHGSRQQTAFTVPETFDDSREYEVVFWAKIGRAHV